MNTIVLRIRITQSIVKYGWWLTLPKTSKRYLITQWLSEANIISSPYNSMSSTFYCCAVKIGYIETVIIVTNTCFRMILLPLTHIWFLLS